MLVTNIQEIFAENQNYKITKLENIISEVEKEIQFKYRMEVKEKPVNYR